LCNLATKVTANDPGRVAISLKPATYTIKLSKRSTGKHMYVMTWGLTASNIQQ